MNEFAANNMKDAIVSKDYNVAKADDANDHEGVDDGKLPMLKVSTSINTIS